VVAVNQQQQIAEGKVGGGGATNGGARVENYFIDTNLGGTGNVGEEAEEGSSDNAEDEDRPNQVEGVTMDTVH
jgi:hypothetical protein